MTDLYLDNDVALQVLPILRAAGHGVWATRDLGRTRASDADQLLFAARNGWTLITHNRGHYVLLHDAWRRWSADWGVRTSHAGIVVAP
ncbi:MAG TPA: DUF5615 family PIN-like protein [Thermomicrobiales bacterium]|nr:DUF5615 family PIN-like protein [Thermomicrobiales bacterium]